MSAFILTFPCQYFFCGIAAVQVESRTVVAVSHFLGSCTNMYRSLCTLRVLLQQLIAEFLARGGRVYDVSEVWTVNVLNPASWNPETH